jgi:uncharacterized membrane protein YkvA (DUF1232 family)
MLGCRADPGLATFARSASTRQSVSVSTLEWALVGFGVFLLVYAAAVVALIVMGRRRQARALATFIPDCIVLLRRLLGDSRVSRGRKLILLALVAYLAMPFDLVPDFIPVAGQLDDAIIAALALRIALRAGGPQLLREHWRGPTDSLAVVARLAYRRQ